MRNSQAIPVPATVEHETEEPEEQRSTRCTLAIRNDIVASDHAQKQGHEDHHGSRPYVKVRMGEA